jgi:hypothetical protein
VLQVKLQQGEDLELGAELELGEDMEKRDEMEELGEHPVLQDSSNSIEVDSNELVQANHFAGSSNMLHKISDFLDTERVVDVEEISGEFVQSMEAEEWEAEAEELLQNTQEGDVVLYDINCQQFQVGCFLGKFMVTNTGVSGPESGAGRILQHGEGEVKKFG